MTTVSNFMYQSSPQSEQMYNGGYPYGYPPNMSLNAGYEMQIPNQSVYSPFISPFPQPQPGPFIPEDVSPVNGYNQTGTIPQYEEFIPGVTSPLELEDGKGNTIIIPATGYSQGGATVSQGGFNPVTGMISQPIAGAGYNPHMQFIGNPGYNSQQRMDQGFAPYYPGQNNGYNSQQRMDQGFAPYYPGQNNGYNNQYTTPYGYNNQYMMPYGYGQNQFDYQLQEILYNEQVSAMDVRSMLEQVILTDEEREKVDRTMNDVVGLDYYGRPIYNNSNYAYRASQRMQSEFEEARLNHQKHFTMLSKIAHAYSGEKIDEESAMKRFDPVPPPVEQPKIFNYWTATEEERKQYERDMRVQATYDLEVKLSAMEYNNYLYNQQKEAAFAQIKVSHDRLIGVEPGQSYDLKTFMDNGYKIGVNIAMQQAKSANRNGTYKYSRNDYRASLSQHVSNPVPITSKNDEYVSIEQMLKGVYDRNKRTDAVLRTQDRQTTYTSEPVFSTDAVLRTQDGQTTYTSEPVFATEFEAHQYFLQEMQKRKEKDDIRRAVM